MGSRWRKAKPALGLNLCVYVPRSLDGDGDGDDDAYSPTPRRAEDEPSPLSEASRVDSRGALMPTTPTPHLIRLQALQIGE